MNVVIENQNSNIISELRIDTIKRLTGVFDVAVIFKEISAISYDKVILDITALNNYTDINVIKSLISFIKPDNLIMVVGNTNITTEYLESIIELGFYNFAYNSNHISSLYNSPNTYDDAIVLVNKTKNKAKIIGIKNITKHAGATTLTYVLKKTLQNKKKVVAFEIDKMDFNFFYDKTLISIPENKLEFTMEKYYNKSDIILIDLNESTKAKEMCDDILYLVEPTMIKINHLMMVKPTVFQDLRGEKIILNKNVLNKDEIEQFESEAHLKVFCAIPAINERQKNNNYIDTLIQKLNL